MRRLLTHPSPVLFLSLFAAQAGFLVLAPILPALADDLGVSTAAVGQLRTVSGLAGGVAATLLAVAPVRRGPRALLAAGLTLLGIASATSAAAPSFAVLAAAQALLGVAMALLLSSGVAAVAEWAPEERRAGVLACALSGQPAAWVVGMPLIGVVAGVDWRWAWIAVPFAASALALAGVGLRARDAPRAPAAGGWRWIARDRALLAWAAGELLAYSGWSGTLVYAGALLLDSYDASAGAVGLLLGAAAVTYFPAAFLARRWVERHARRMLVVLGGGLAVTVAAYGLARPALWASALLFAALVFLAGGRTMAGSALGLALAPDRSVAAMGVRTAAAQFGNLGGAGLGGVALALGGYGALGVVLAGLFALGVLPHAVIGVRRPRVRVRVHLQPAVDAA